MKSIVVFFALTAVACASWAPLAQPYHYPAVVLDARGRPLDTPEVINARALHLQAKALEGHYGLAPAYGWAGALGYGHRLYKRSLAHVGHALPAAVSHQSVVSHAVAAPVVAHAVAAPVVAHAAVPAAVSHQSRIDVHASPAVAVAGVGYASPYNYGYANGWGNAYNYGFASPYNYGYNSALVHPW